MQVQAQALERRRIAGLLSSCISVDREPVWRLTVEGGTH